MIINNPNELPDSIIQTAINMMYEESPGRIITEITVRATESPDEYGITPIFDAAPFNRIRRITGYLVGTTDRWNSAKRAELRDRVKHGG